ncbi:MAG: T9SS C-terminal target domain-containing protein [Bacteroidetes bacterium]|nr:MAG: T9SS C-terminal target domain-containing protein [Bacteroidota bacterium]
MFIKQFLSVLVFLSAVSLASSQTLVINEMMASNATTLADEDGDFEDWIEIYNASGSAVNLSGFGLSDDYDNPFRWTFPEVTLPNGGFLLVWASGKDRKTPGQPLHTNFSISSSGEEIILTHPDGQRIDEIAPTPVPTDISFGRKPDASGGWLFFTEPTPGQSNTSYGFAGVTTPPVFSHISGFYTDAFTLELTNNIENVQIYYTLDGSTPTVDSQLYTESIAIESLVGVPNGISMIPTNNNNDPGPPYYEGWQPPAGEVFKTNIVRAITVKDNHITGKAATHSYLIDPLGANRYSLPVFFLNTDEENFFDNDTGIYVHGYHNNMFQRGREWERPIHLSFFEKDGSLAFSGDMGVRIHGGTTRSRPRKSLRLYARNDYGDSWVNYQLFPEKHINQYKRFLLRNSGNDWDQSVFRDGFMQYLARDLNVETQYYRPALVFLNGEYWGIHNIRDRYDHHYIFSHYGLEEHEMTVVQNNSGFAYGNPDGVSHYNSMRSFINHNDMSNADNYAHVTTLMDPESFIDNQITGIYVMNTDWPGNNSNFFRRFTDSYLPNEPAGLDGRWRWHILDTDFGFWLDFFYVPGVDQGAAHNTLAFAAEPNGPSWPNPPWATFLFRRLLQNETFKTDFINRFADLLNTTLSVENVVSVIDSIETALQPEMQEHIDRWRRPTSMNEWQNNVQRMRTFGQQRTQYQRQHIQSFFNLTGQLNIHLSVNDSQMGHIKINTIEPDVSSSWSGIYFKGVPVKLTAIPREGFIFTHWSGTESGSNPLLAITPENDRNIIANFEPTPGFPGDELNPPAYPLSLGDYEFNRWDANNPQGTFPPYMLFLQSSMSDPALGDPMTHRYHIPQGDYHSDDQHLEGFPYMLTGRSRINGLGHQGISFINTGRDRDLGAAVLALDTRGYENVFVSWTGGTLMPNARVYAIRLQYKIDPSGPFVDVTDENGQPIEYLRSETVGDEQHFGPILLPSMVSNQEYVQLRWKYYFTGTQLDMDHGRRDMLRLDNIRVTTLSTGSGNEDTGSIKDKPFLFQNFPNPSDGVTHISFSLPQTAEVGITLYDAMGREREKIVMERFSRGTHTVTVNSQHLEAGLYFYRMESNGFSSVRKMMLR